MAYAAVKSLTHTILCLLSSSHISVATSRKSLQSALDHATSLKDTLDRCSRCVAEMDELLIKDSIELALSAHFDQLREDHVDSFAKTAKKMKENILESEQKQKQKLAKIILKKPSPSREEEEEESSSSSSMVGLSDQFLQIRDLLTDAEGSESFVARDIISITGMAGIGKTQLARKLVHDPSVKATFQRRFFVRMGRDYISVVAYENDKQVIQGDYQDLDWKQVTRDRKCLIVLDDVWKKITSFRQLYYMIDNSKGSRILVTCRKNSDIERNHFKMRFLNEEESWELLRRKVFGEDQEEADCPQQLVKAGKKIAEECEGLPLLIIAVAPILFSKAQMNPEAWKRVAEKPDSVLQEASYQISEQLLSNYHQLREDLKLCFLYITAFPKKYVVWATTIAYLWFSEGFISNWDLVARSYLNSLHENNLVVGRQKGHWSEVLHKACSLHCAYWYVCRREAENKKILYTINSLANGLDVDRIKGQRRLAIYTNVLFAIKVARDFMATISTVRSLLCTGPYLPYQVSMCWEWKLLRVLSVLTIRFYEFPVEVVQLIWLKYLGLTCNANLPPSISKLCNLQFLIVHQHWSIKRVGVESYLPVEIWDLQELEVLQIFGRNLPDPPSLSVVLPKLRKLLDVGIESCSEEVYKSLPGLQKLRVQIELAPHCYVNLNRCFYDISRLNRLQSFQSVVMNPTISHPPPRFSTLLGNVDSLTLSRLGFPWEDMDTIALLASLRVLKLKSYAFRGKLWEGEGMRFRSLTQLFIEDTVLMQWTAGDRTFTDVTRLIMKNCHKLQEIPLIAPVSPHYVEIKLVDCNPSVETRTKEKYSAHKKSFNLTATYSWKDEKVESH